MGLTARADYIYGGGKMKKVVLAVLAVCLFMFCGCAFAAQGDWKADGTWDYESVISPQSVVIDGGEVWYSATEEGIIALNMAETDGQEFFSSYICAGRGISTVESIYGTDSRKYGGEPYVKNLDNIKYVPGDTYSFTTQISIRGYVVTQILMLKQTAENKMEGTVTLTMQGQTITGEVVATKRTISADAAACKLDGKWNYQSEIEPQEVYVDGYSVMYGSDESGTIQLNMTENSGAEFFDSYTYSGKGITNISGERSSYTMGPLTRNFTPVMYRPGESCYVDAGKISIQGYPVTEKFILTQCGENKIEGIVALTLKGQTVWGKITATREGEEPQPHPTPSSGSGGGGCNAGYGIVALLCAAPLFFKKQQ